MSFSFSKEAIEELKNQIDIVDVIGRSVELKRAGANYKGLCPFHNEKTPSFIVSPQKQIFTCFGGCGASGDVVTFVKRYYNLDFNEAVEKLADEYGIEIQKNSHKDDREKYYEVNREAARLFYRNLTEKKNPGYTYMQRRGIQDSTIKKFGLGYAEDSWNNLYDDFKKKGTDEKILIELGLISKKGDRCYDKFRNRVIFPIINTAGKVIGFGGRALDNEAMPKYLNSPENKVFQKKNNLYALNSTRQDIGKEGSAIIVEGYMDAISLYQNGVRNVAASLGTALTENQAKLINRYTKNVILSYDADAAGQKAALRGIEVLRGENCKVKAIREAESYDGPSLIIAYAPCINHGVKAGMNKSMAEMKHAVLSGYWNLLRYNPQLAKEGKNPLSIDSGEPTENYRDFIMGEVRYNSLELKFPDRAEKLFEEAEELSKERYETLLSRKKSMDN